MKRVKETQDLRPPAIPQKITSAHSEKKKGKKKVVFGRKGMSRRVEEIFDREKD